MSFKDITNNLSKLLSEDTKDINKINRRTKILLLVIGVAAAIFSTYLIRKLTATKVLENDYRQQIIEILREEKIAHLRYLQRRLQCGTSILIWHLQVLEDFHHIKKKKYGQYVVYYLTENPPTENFLTTYYAALHPIRRNILVYATKVTKDGKNHFTVNDIVDSTKLQRNAVNYHLKKLLQLGIIEELPQEKAFKLNNKFFEDIQNVLTLPSIVAS